MHAGIGRSQIIVFPPNKKNHQTKDYENIHLQTEINNLMGFTEAPLGKAKGCRNVLKTVSLAGEAARVVICICLFHKLENASGGNVNNESLAF